MPAFTQHAIAAGWNNVVGLVKIGLIVPSGNIAFGEPSANHNYIPGRIIVRLDLLDTVAGVDKLTWGMAATFEQYKHLSTTFCAGGYRGKVTVKTRWFNNAYANFNAIMALQTEGMAKMWHGFSSIEVVFFDLRVIP